MTGELRDPALVHALMVTGGLALFCWVASLLTRNYSWVDRIWSVALPGYVLWFASRAQFADARLDLMVALAVLWGARLSYNFWRKGGYTWKGEDYRWPALEAKIGVAKFQLLNATFIAPVQNAVLLALSLPAWVALRHAGAPLGILDGAAAAAFLAFFAGEVVADQQQWRFQKEKRARKARGEAGPEFVTTGLFSWSRHPNFFCEQAMWWAFYLFSIAAGAPLFNLALAGPIALVLIFQGSTAFTEKLTVEKYPAYAEYQRRVSRLWPIKLRSR
jgi:steroid 5-alpha reductase family enzyme